MNCVYHLVQCCDKGTTVIFFFLRKSRYLKHIGAVHRSLGIPADYAAMHCVPLQMEARKLTSIGTDIYQREQHLVPGAAAAWQAMRDTAAQDGIELQLVSAFRSAGYQENILRKKLEKGLPMEEILRVSAAPGYSEHHTGRALDLTTPGCAVLEEEFDQTAAFAWLTESAGHFCFSLSYPRDNRFKFAYEPWHWAWSE
jgi:D-alanyl-D-alanine carboxypeptidase